MGSIREVVGFRKWREVDSGSQIVVVVRVCGSSLSISSDF
jgi:hypothetical protein